MNNPVSISSASEGVCLLCGAEGPTFAVSTPCGRLVDLPVCAKELFTIVVAQNRSIPPSTRGANRGRGKQVSSSVQTRSIGDTASAPQSASGLNAIAGTSAA